MTGRQTVADLGEKRVIREIIAPLASGRDGVVGIGDDAAVVEFPDGQELVVTTDRIPEDLLALRFGLMDAFHHGRYLAEVNLSDVGAMGAQPLGLVAALALPDDFEIAYLREFVAGMVAAGKHWGAPLLGGDTKWGSAPSLSATALGAVPRGQALTRHGARPGDRLFVSGTVGGFGAALAYFASADERRRSVAPEYERLLCDRLVRPNARVELGVALRESQACTACMDISDGLGQTLSELTEASAASVVIDASKLPVHPAVDAVAELLDVNVLDLVLGIGLDLELVGALRAGQSLPPAVETQITIIGSFVAGPSSLIDLGDGRLRDLPARGWQHFTGSALDHVRSGPKPLG